MFGLPNVGKSTLFNALTCTQAAQAANYPFCTIEPNVGQVDVPDERLQTLGKLASSRQIIPTRVDFVDIAGLVKGAAKGEGLGNQFLGHIREVHAICHVVRCFENGSVTHVENRIDPIDDAMIVETELLLADLESLQKRVLPLQKKARGGDSQAKETLELIESLIPILEAGKPVHASDKNFDPELLKSLQLLTSKPFLLVCNMDEDSFSKGNEYSRQVEAFGAERKMPVLKISAHIESELSALEDKSERVEMLQALNIETSGLDLLIRAGYDLLGLITFFTAGEKETRAWAIPKGISARDCAGVIHTDFMRGFIAADVIAYEDYVESGGEQAARAKGKGRLEGRDYIVSDGDVIHFRFNV
ncbi:MAG: redox-regulated ATPase YchF [Pseudomonadota bacterium]